MVTYWCITPNFLWCFLRFSLFRLFFRKTPVFTSAMPITNGRWIYEAFEQIMTLSSIREYVPSIRKCTSIHTHSLYTNHQTKQKIKTQIKQTWRKREKHFYDLYYLFLVHVFFSCSIPQWIKLRSSTGRIYRH